MKRYTGSLIRLFAAFLLAVPLLLSGCGGNDNSFPPVKPIEERYEYDASSRVYTYPAMLTTERRIDFLTLTIDDGFFYCATADSEQANKFVNAQRTLLQFLGTGGVELQKLNYYAMDFDDSFSEHEKKRAHIALSDTKSYRQVLVTLQTLWGDYVDYGYLHALANAIAAHLGWQTDAVEAMEQAALDSFFADNPAALNLLYPCFSEDFATEETVRNCKALSKRLLEKLDLRTVLTKPIDEQVNDFHTLVDGYAQNLSVTFSRQESGYAYYGEYLPLRINTTYAVHFIDHDYEDYYRTEQEELGNHSLNYFSDYHAIFQTIDIISKEIASSVEYFGLENEAGTVTINWLCAESAIERSGSAQSNYYHPMSNGTVFITQIDGYLHEYFHHLEHLMNPNAGHTAQSQMFCELGRSHSRYAHHNIEWPFTQTPWADVFYNCTGRTYQPGTDDYFEGYDILCYITKEYDLNYLYARNGMNSFTHYLLDLYGEDATYQMLLFPESIETVTEKTWEELQADWIAHISEKFDGVELPDWIAEGQDT